MPTCIYISKQKLKLQKSGIIYNRKPSHKHKVSLYYNKDNFSPACPYCKPVFFDSIWRDQGFYEQMFYCTLLYYRRFL